MRSRFLLVVIVGLLSLGSGFGIDRIALVEGFIMGSEGLPRGATLSTRLVGGSEFESLAGGRPSVAIYEVTSRSTMGGRSDVDDTTMRWVVAVIDGHELYRTSGDRNEAASLIRRLRRPLKVSQEELLARVGQYVLCGAGCTVEETGWDPVPESCITEARSAREAEANLLYFPARVTSEGASRFAILVMSPSLRASVDIHVCENEKD